MRRFLSYFLILILVLPCFIFSSLAAPVDSDNFTLDILPYCNSQLNVAGPSGSFTYNFNFNESISFKYIDAIVITDCADFDIVDNVSGGAILCESIGHDAWRIHGAVDVTNLTNYVLTVNSIVGGSYFNLVKCDIIYDSYMYFNLPLNYYWRDDYRVVNGTYDSYPSYMNSYAVNQVGGHESFYMYTLTFDWEKYDYITIFIEDYSTQLVDFSANVPITQIILDSEASHFDNRLTADNIQHELSKKGPGSVNAGVEYLQSLLYKDIFEILEKPSIRYFIADGYEESGKDEGLIEMDSYQYDKIKSEKEGTNCYKKDLDHSIDATRYVLAYMQEIGIAPVV